LPGSTESRLFRIGRTQSALGAALVRYYGLKPEVPEAWLYLEEARAERVSIISGKSVRV
jgi:hypothetical protein